LGHHGYPAIGITFHAAEQYCKWLSYKTKRKYRLPTEIEWEYACRANVWDAAPFKDKSLLDKLSEKVHPGARELPSPDWQASDPQVPKSKWWLTDAPFVGFRVVCEDVKPAN
jgi:hypothetical protein